MSVSPDFQFSALARALFLEAQRDGESISGLALGVGWYGGETETFYLVSDLRRPAPLWVSENDLVRQRWTSWEPTTQGGLRAGSEAFPGQAGNEQPSGDA